MAGKPSAHNAAACRKNVTEASWNTNYIDKLLGQLSKKAWCRSAVCCRTDAISRGSSSPCYTKDEFLANMLEEQGVNQALFARIAVALF